MDGFSIVKINGQSMLFYPQSYTKPLKKNTLRAFKACNAEYIANMEGDDFWTDPYRLQKHIDFLDNHLECAMSINAFMYADYDDGDFYINTVPEAYTPQGFKYLTTEDAIVRGGPNYSTCVYRSKTISKIIENEFFNENLITDWSTTIMACHYFGYAAFINQVMNVYRSTERGLWNGLDRIEQSKRIIIACEMLDEYTEYKYSNVFNKAIQTEKKFSKNKKQRKSPMNIIHQLTPPVIKWIIKGLIPPLIWEKLVGKAL
jgi:hypothetical protein